MYSRTGTIPICFISIFWQILKKIQRSGSERILINTQQCTEVRFTSFLSGGFTTMAVINPTGRKLAKSTSVHCATIRPCHRYLCAALFQGLAGHTYDSGPVVRILDYWQGKLRFKSYALLPFVSERTIARAMRGLYSRQAN